MGAPITLEVVPRSSLGALVSHGPVEGIIGKPLEPADIPSTLPSSAKISTKIFSLFSKGPYSPLRRLEPKRQNPSTSGRFVLQRRMWRPFRCTLSEKRLVETRLWQPRIRRQPLRARPAQKKTPTYPTCGARRVTVRIAISMKTEQRKVRFTPHPLPQNFLR